MLAKQLLVLTFASAAGLNFQAQAAQGLLPPALFNRQPVVIECLVTEFQPMKRAERQLSKPAILGRRGTRLGDARDSLVVASRRIRGKRQNRQPEVVAAFTMGKPNTTFQPRSRGRLGLRLARGGRDRRYNDRHQRDNRRGLRYDERRDNYDDYDEESSSSSDHYRGRRVHRTGRDRRRGVRTNRRNRPGDLYYDSQDETIRVYSGDGTLVEFDSEGDRIYRVREWEPRSHGRVAGGRNRGGRRGRRLGLGRRRGRGRFDAEDEEEDEDDESEDDGDNDDWRDRRQHRNRNHNRDRRAQPTTRRPRERPGRDRRDDNNRARRTPSSREFTEEGDEEEISGEIVAQFDIQPAPRTAPPRTATSTRTRTRTTNTPTPTRTSTTAAPTALTAEIIYQTVTVTVTVEPPAPTTGQQAEVEATGQQQEEADLNEGTDGGDIQEFDWQP